MPICFCSKISPMKKDNSIWICPDTKYLKMDNSLLPEVKWEDEEPTEVEINIKNNI
jgi:hypothetical protein